tara:strand:+ start:164 stop:1027 length:864 start_codon:yes stop_codon:yes gene_type:complete
MSKKFKTPLRYPGGKSRATKILLEYIPENYNSYIEPFIGGGSMAIALTRRNPDLKVTINDLYYPLYCFWTVLRDVGPQLQDHLFNIKTYLDRHDDEVDRTEAHREAFNIAKEKLSSGTGPYETAVNFYVCNKCSFSGLSENSSFSAQASRSNFSLNGINSLLWYNQAIQGWDIKNEDYSKVVNPSAFNFLDPPYLIKDNLYGSKGDLHKSFDHNRLAELMKVFTGNAMITYNSSKQVEDLYPTFSKLQWDLTYTMRSTQSYGADQDKRKELLLVNYNIDNSTGEWYR